MKVQFSDNAFMPGPRTAGAEPAPATKDFASVLAKASSTKESGTVKKTDDAPKKAADDVKKTRDDVVTKGKGKTDATPAQPKAERTKDIPGRSYDEIVAGPRNGMMLNDSGNVRDGQAFLRVEREGRTFHIYGTGKDRQIFEVGREADKKVATPKKTTSQTGAAIAPS